MTHTPGPWRADRVLRTAINAGKKHIAMVSCFNMESTDERTIADEEHEANVNLILAAPDLLEACKTALALIEISTDYKGMCTSNILKQAITLAEKG